MITIEPNRTALLVMDFQSDIVEWLGEKAAPVLERAASVVAAARRAQLLIVYVVVGFRPGYPEVSPRNLTFAALSRDFRERRHSGATKALSARAKRDG
jgi:nicotinamidase-related amidase